ncbi:MAG: hypothetical protein KDB27_12370, partial [Planctomycetales bacterium]|nr:hypothetical protein [Planctomycetales bacterium]
GEPEVSDSPLGPGRVTIVASAWIGGAMIGIGLVLLASPMTVNGVRDFGRRATDQIRVSFGRRQTDRQQTETQFAAVERRGHGDRRRQSD